MVRCETSCPHCQSSWPWASSACLLLCPCPASLCTCQPAPLCMRAVPLPEDSVHLLLTSHLSYILFFLCDLVSTVCSCCHIHARPSSLRGDCTSYPLNPCFPLATSQPWQPPCLCPHEVTALPVSCGGILVLLLAAHCLHEVTPLPQCLQLLWMLSGSLALSAAAVITLL